MISITSIVAFSNSSLNVRFFPFIPLVLHLSYCTRFIFRTSLSPLTVLTFIFRDSFFCVLTTILPPFPFCTFSSFWFIVSPFSYVSVIIFYLHYLYLCHFLLAIFDSFLFLYLSIFLIFFNISSVSMCISSIFSHLRALLSIFIVCELHLFPLSSHLITCFYLSFQISP